jgi:RNA polymerase sigma-70 factor (ECF subfamily)
MVAQMTRRLNDLSDETLIRRALQGDVEAFGDLYTRYLDQLYRYVFYRVADEQVAEDLTENIFLKVWENLAKLQKPHTSFPAWLYRIAHNVIIDHYRTQKPTVSWDDLSERQMSTMDDSPEKVLLDVEESKQLAKAISQLKPRLAQVIVCRFIQKLSHAQTAEIMGLNEGHIRVLQYRALKQLRQILSIPNETKD